MFKMNKKITVIIILLALFSSISFAGNEARDEVKLIASGNNEFAFNLYSQIKNLPEIKQAEGNLFFSPYSISTALAMTYTGACGNTAKEMADVLKFIIVGLTCTNRAAPRFNSTSSFTGMYFTFVPPTYDKCPSLSARP